MRPLLIGFGAGLVSALLLFAGYLFASPLVVLLMYLSPLPLAVAGLSFGLPAVLAGIAGTVVVGLQVSFGLTIGHLLAVGLPVAVLIRQGLLARSAEEAGPDATDVADGRQWYPLGQLVVWLGGLAMVLFAAVMVATADEPGGLVGFLEERLLLLLEHFGTRMGAGLSGGTQAETAARMARLMPAIGTVTWMVVMALNFALAQGLARRFGWNLRPSPRFDDLVLPRWLGLVLGAAAVAAFSPGDFGLVAGVVFAVTFGAYLVQGLSVLHKAARLTPVPGLVMTGVFMAIGLFGVPAVLVAGLGLVEDWFRLRRKIGGGRPGQEV